MRRQTFLFLYDAPAPAGGAGGGAPSGAPAGGSGGGAPAAPAHAPAPAAAPAPAGAPAGGPAAGGAPAGGAPPVTEYRYTEDRSQWIPPHRLREVSEQTASLRAQLQLQDRRMRALVGLEQPAAPRDPEQEAIRTKILEMFPELRELGTMRQTQQQLHKTQERQLLTHAQGQATTAAEKYAKAAGITPDKLPKNFTQRIAGLMARFIQEDETGERDNRFLAGDASLIDEFVADATGTFLTPFRTAANVDAARNVERNQRLPQRGPAGAPGPQAGGGSGAKRSREDTRKAAREFVRTNLG